MSSRFTVERAVLVVLGLGVAGFVTLHSFVLLSGSGEQTMSLVRTAWFVGLAVLAVVATFLSVQHRSTA
jgi:hypothetical protein